MSITVKVTVEDLDERYTTTGYRIIELESSSTVDGSYSQVDTVSLANPATAPDHFYELEDAAGSLSTWYRYRFAGAAGAAPLSDYSNPFQVTGVTRQRIRQFAINNYRAGYVLVNTGTSATVFTTADARFKSSGFPVNRGKGTWLMPSSGSRAGQTRLIVSSAPSVGTITVDPAWSGTLANLDEGEWHWLVEPEEWNLAINRGVKRYFYLERVPVVGVDAQDEYDLEDLFWLENKDDVHGVWYYPLGTSLADDGNDEPWGGNGRWWRVREDGGRRSLIVYPEIDADTTLYLEATRRMPELHTDASALPEQANLELCAALAYDEVLAALTAPKSGAAKDREAYARQRLQHAVDVLRPLLYRHRVKIRLQPPQPSTPPSAPRSYSAR